jgi:hypothetical protein
MLGGRLSVSQLQYRSQLSEKRNSGLRPGWPARLALQAMESIVCPVCGFIAETTDASRLRTVWADHLLGGCGDDVTAITTAMESCIEQRQELWRSGMTDEVPGLTVTIDLLWEALRYARLAEPPVAASKSSSGRNVGE